MTGRSIILNAIYFALFLALQVIFFLNVSFTSYAFCFIYIGFLLLLPVETPPLTLLALSLFLGLSVDIFYNTLGIHTAACVLIGYLRPHIINFLTPRGGYDEGSELTVFALGFPWLAAYASIVVIIHHITLFMIEAWEFDTFFLSLFKALCSALFTLVVYFLVQYLVFSRQSK
jgi:hypothetical protein